MKKLAISLVTFNSERFLHDFCRSLQQQTFKDWNLHVIDNASGDQSVTLVREYFPHAIVSVQNRNLGFSRAHNLNIAWSESQYVLVVNPDVVLIDDCIEQLVRALERNPELASVGPKLLSGSPETDLPVKTVDSCGLQLFKNYRVRDRYQSEPDRDMIPRHVFGISGACVCYRREALEDVKMPKTARHTGLFEYFDEDFFAYKEDVDIAWRMLLCGWKHYFVPQAVALHRRSVSGAKSAWSDRKSRRAVNQLSYRNHLLTVYKNHFCSLTIRYFLPIILFELQKFFYLLFLDGSSVRGLRSCHKLLRVFREKRHFIKTRRRISSRQFTQWFS